MTREHQPHPDTSGSPLSLDLGTLPAPDPHDRVIPDPDGRRPPGGRPNPGGLGPEPSDSGAGVVAPPAPPSGPIPPGPIPPGPIPPGTPCGPVPAGTPGGPAPADVVASGPPTTDPADAHVPTGSARPRTRPWLTLLDRLSLQAKLVAVLLAALVVALTAMGYGVQAVLSGYLVDQIDTQLTQTAQLASQDPEYLSALLRQGSRNPRLPSPILIQVNVDGASVGPILIGGYGSDEGQSVRFPVLSSSSAASLLGRAYTVTASDGSQWRASSFASPGNLELPNGEQGPAAVTILESLGGVQHAVAKVRFISVVFGLLVMALCTMAGWLAIRRAFVPLREVEDTAAAIAAGDLSRRVRERPRSTEVGRLTASLNGMLAQIEQAFRHREASEARTRRFAADASHELRTPLVSIRGFAELYRQGAVPPDEVPRTMRRIEDEATRMGGLVEDLLMLARLDEQRPGRSEPVDLAVLANDAVHDARGLDSTRRVSLVGLNGGGPKPSVVIGDEDRLRQVVANLMANAVRHTPEGTAIEVAVGVTAEPGTQAEGAGRSTPRALPRAVLEVRDHGPGLTPEQAERVFERFYRVDSSRTRGKGGGSGLGLSIVSAVVCAHGGTVETRTTPGGGATFRVEIPAAPPGNTFG
jgi:two-component system OmpR family sensor kinase